MEKVKDFLKKHQTKLLFVIEFIASFFVALLFLKIFTAKHYGGFWSLKHLLILIPFAIIFVASFIRNIFLNKETIEKLWMIFLIPVGMFFLVYIIPTFAPDEQAHLWKSYEISTGTVITKLNKDGSYPTTIPKFYEESVIPNISNYNDMFDKSRIHTNYKDTTTVTNPASGYFSPLYLFSSIGLLAGRILGMNGIYAEYLARLCNYVVFLILGYYSMKKIPFGKLAVGVLLFFPMCLQQGTSMSIDCLIIGLSIFYVAYTFYLRYKEEAFTKKEKIIYCITSVLIAVAKYVYLPICCLSLLLIGTKKLNKKQIAILILGTIIIPLLIAGIWFKVSSRYEDKRSYIYENNINFGEQLHFVIQQPVHFAKIILNDAVKSSEPYLYGAIGANLGWLNINVPHLKITILLFLLILSVYFEDNSQEMKRVEWIYTLIITLGVYFLTIVALYLIWSSVGSEVVSGVQGRYFVPILILPALCLARKNNYVKIKNIAFILLIILTAIDLSVVKVIFDFFV